MKQTKAKSTGEIQQKTEAISMDREYSDKINSSLRVHVIFSVQ